jgi:hypothetical protein
MLLTIKRNNKVDFKLQSKHNLKYMFDIACAAWDKLLVKYDM